MLYELLSSLLSTFFFIFIFLCRGEADSRIWMLCSLGIFCTWASSILWLIVVVIIRTDRQNSPNNFSLTKECRESKEAFVSNKDFSTQTRAYKLKWPIHPIYQPIRTNTHLNADKLQKAEQTMIRISPYFDPCWKAFAKEHWKAPLKKKKCKAKIPHIWNQR